MPEAPADEDGVLPRAVRDRLVLAAIEAESARRGQNCRHTVEFVDYKDINAMRKCMCFPRRRTRGRPC
jgi:hypothetical protein